MKSPYISRVIIKNFRNFLDIDVSMEHKGVIVGENNIGKTNFLRAIQLILDPSLSDEDRMLDVSDFNDSIDDPMGNNQEIIVQICISNYKHNIPVLAALKDATVKGADGQEQLLLNYRFFPQVDDRGNKEYQYVIYMGENMNCRFGSYERKFLNLRVIQALRDVESELRNTRKSPVKKMLDDYGIDMASLENIAKEYQLGSKKVLELEQIQDLITNINKRFSSILGNDEFGVSLQAMEIDPSKVLASLKVMMANRNATDTSLGLNNILYISLILQMIQDKTIPTFLDAEKGNELECRAKETNCTIIDESSEDSAPITIIEGCYNKSPLGNYNLKDDLAEINRKILYEFMTENYIKNSGVTILAIEEPEAHLHPVYQRLIYKDVINRNASSVLLTTHSTHITAIAPIKSIVHLHTSGDGTIAHSTANMPIEEGEFLDVERYLDVKRGEIYLGKAVILVEGIAEEYIVPKLAEQLGKPLDEKGIVVCNVNCTAFRPYIKLLEFLQIPYAVITDGDFYRIKKEKDIVISEEDISEKNAEKEPEREYHVLMSSVTDEYTFGFLGLENMLNITQALGKKDYDGISDCNILRAAFAEQGIFVGTYTFEVDMMETSSTNKDAKDSIFSIYSKLVEDKPRKISNFKNKFDDGDYEFCLRRIEDKDIGKGRFAQRLAGSCLKTHCPNYIEKAIKYIYEKVDD